MSFTKTAAVVIAVIALLISLSPAAYSQDANRTNPDGKEKTVTGCLNKGSNPGEYTFTDEKGTAMTVTGPATLEKHSANHKVELTGTESTQGGKTMLNVSKIRHISTDCSPGK